MLVKNILFLQVQNHNVVQNIVLMKIKITSEQNNKHS